MQEQHGEGQSTLTKLVITQKGRDYWHTERLFDMYWYFYFLERVDCAGCTLFF